MQLPGVAQTNRPPSSAAPAKHLRQLRGDAAEEGRLGSALPQKPAAPAGEQPTAPALLLAETWDTAADLAGWWMSEKLDGLRAYWDGNQFVSRLGNTFHAPDWFLAGLPATPLDGELWVGRGQFARASGLVRRQDKTELWKEVRYLVFDAPSAPGGFEGRIAFVADQFARLKPPTRRRTPTNSAAIWIICAPNSPASKRSAARG